MIQKEDVNRLRYIYSNIIHNNSDVLDEYLNSDFDFESIGDELLNDPIIPTNDGMYNYVEVLGWLIEISSYVENETSYVSIITDELYDKLVEKYIDCGNVQPIGSHQNTVVGIDELPHIFPELRGSLAKVHFIYDKEIPDKDSRKSLEGYLNNVVRQMKDAGIEVGKCEISVDLKYDGVSHIIELFNGNNTSIKVLTRGNVDTNLGKNITPVFEKMFPGTKGGINLLRLATNVDLNMLPYNIWEPDSLGIKVETYMKSENFDKFKKDFNIKRCNRRSAVTSICNQNADNVDVSMSQYLNMKHFQIASSTKLKLDENESDKWIYIGKINGRHQYLYVENPMIIDLSNIPEACETINSNIEACKIIADKLNVPIDGAVVTFLNQPIISLLGRKNDKNMFQVAFKFPAGVQKTTIKEVDFQVGKVAGRLTPVARLNPIVINGNTISNVTLSNKDKLERLKIHIGDEVIIKYDIVPKIFKDETCKEMEVGLVEFPSLCPICGGDIVNECCSNPNCPSKLVGYIYTFVQRNNIKGGIGLNTIIDFVDAGFLKSIGDLYRLSRIKKELYSLKRYGETSIENILSGIRESMKLYPHQIIGAIGIPGIGLKTMEKICRKINILGNIDNLKDLRDAIIDVPTIGESKADALITGIYLRKKDIEDICKNVDILQYETETPTIMKVCFSEIRDDDFESFLNKKGIKTASSFSSKVKYLIVPDEPVEKLTTKMKAAKERGDDCMITISKAKELFGYE